MPISCLEPRRKKKGEAAYVVQKYNVKRLLGRTRPWVDTRSHIDRRTERRLEDHVQSHGAVLGHRDFAAKSFHHPSHEAAGQRVVVLQNNSQSPRFRRPGTGSRRTTTSTRSCRQMVSTRFRVTIQNETRD